MCIIKQLIKKQTQTIGLRQKSRFWRVSIIVFLTFVSFVARFSVAEELQSENPQSNEGLNNSAAFKVAFINPSVEGDPYWDRYMDYMKVAAATLNIDLQIEYAKGKRWNTPDIARKIMQQTPSPDYLVYIFQYGQSLKILTLAESMQVKSFIVNTNVTDAEAKLVGKPRQKFKYWIGHLHAANVEAGERLAVNLIDNAQQSKLLDEQGKVHLLAFSGSRDSTAAVDFNRGLANIIRKDDDVILEQLVFSNWSYIAAERQAEGLLQRYPETSVMWSIGENVLLGMLDGARRAGRKPGQDILLGGTVSTARGVKAIQDGLLTANIGGDTWEGARSLVMLYDYHHGVDFKDEDYSILYTTKYVTSRNVQPYVELISKQKWRDIDYKKMSYVLNPNKQLIEFNVHTLLDATK